MTTETIWCPEWCKVTREDHEAQVAAGQTELVHQSDYMAARPMDAILTTLRTIDGTPVLEDPSYEPVMFLDGDEYVSPGDYADYANDVLAWVEKARRTGPHPWLTCPTWCDYKGQDHGCWDVVDGRRTESHNGTPLGERYNLTVEYFADSGEEISREVTIQLDNTSPRSDGTTEVVTLADLALIAEQTGKAAAWLRGEVQIP